MSGSKIGGGIDAESDAIVGECKQTDGKSLSIKTEWIEKLERQAIAKGKTPVFHFKFNSIRPPWTGEWCMIPASLFAELSKHIRTEEE